MTYSESHDYGHAILFICITLMFVILVYEIRKFLKIPSASLLVICGLILRYAGWYIGRVKGAVEIWYKVDEWAVLLFFLPALIFECGFSTHWYTFKRELPQILLMATTAVILNTFLTAVALKYILFFDFDWDQSFLVGALLSATDHIVVVSQLKELKVTKAFETLIQGETLLIDGAVMVLFFVLLKRVTGEHLENGETTEYFFRLTFGGLALGIAFCLVFTFVMKRIINDDVLEVNMTVLTAYLIYYTAEDSGIEVSGAIATVTFGLFMASYGKTLISPAVEHSLHNFWKIIGKNIEGIIFVLGGLILAEISVNSQAVTEAEVWKTIILFIILHIIRGLTVLVHYPLLTRLGLGLSWRDAIVLAFAGAKGVISSSLSLLLWHNKEVDEAYKEMALFVVILCSNFSIFFDSTVVWVAMKLLGLGVMDDLQEHSLLQVTGAIVDATDKRAVKLSKELRLVRWDQAEDFAGTKPLVTKVLEKTIEGRKILEETSDLDHRDMLTKSSIGFQFSKAQIAQEVRKRCLMLTRGLYWEQFEEGFCLGTSALSLIESADISLERLNQGIEGWKTVERKLFKCMKAKSLQALSATCCVGPVMKRINFSYLAEAYDTSSCFIKVHDEVLESLDRGMMKHLDQDIVEQVKAEIDSQIDLAKEFRDSYVVQSYPEVVSFVQTRQVCYAMLNTQRKKVFEAYEKGLIDDHEHGILESAVNRSFSDVANFKSLELGLHD
jgi:NhaP-type Na+/H+ or K+/H+ antiporter